MPQALSSFRIGKMPGRSKADGKEGKEEDEVWQVEKEVMRAVLAADPVNFSVSSDLAGKVEETCGEERSSSGGVAEEPCQHAGQSWDCSQVENELEERAAMNWPLDDEMMRPWEEVSKDEDEITVKRSEGGRLHMDRGTTCTRPCGGASTHEEEGGAQGEEESNRLVHEDAGRSCKQARVRGHGGIDPAMRSKG